MFLSKTVLGMCRLDIFVDCVKNQSLQDFSDWAEKRDEDPWDVSLPGLGIRMINEDFHLAEI